MTLRTKFTHDPKDHFNLPLDSFSIIARFKTFHNLLKNCGQAFYNALISVAKIEKSELWSAFEILKKEGHDCNSMINAIICSKALDETEMIRMLKIRKFNYDECWTSLRYYRSKEFFMQLLSAISKSGYTREYERILFTGGNDDISLFEVIKKVPFPEKKFRATKIIAYN